MTASITHCWKRWLELTIFLIVSLLGLSLAHAGSIEPKFASLAQEDKNLLVSAEFVVRLGSRFVEAVERGVPLHFRFEFALTRKRWYWADEHVAGRVQETRLNYHALTRQYRLTAGSQQQNFDSLDEALRALGRFGRLPVPLGTELVAGEPYRAAVRLSLDHEQLPKPLQIDALADRDWRVEAKTHVWQYVPAAEKQ